MPDPSPSGIIRPEVRQASAYSLSHFEADVKLDQNENPYEISHELKEKIVRRILERDWGRYPEFVPEETVRRVAAFSGWRKDGILVGNGSNELIYVTLIATVGPGRQVAIPQPTFAVYKLMASILGAGVREVLLNPNDLSFDVDAVAAAARDADVVVLCSPNSPTGSVLSLDEASHILEAARGLVVVDEAYHEFGGQTLISLMERYDRLVLLRTFSKAKALAGLRFGYLLGNPALVSELRKAQLPYSVNIFTLAAAEVLMEDWSDDSVSLLVRERERLAGELAERSEVEVFPSHANFLLFRTPYPARRVFDSLYADGVLVRDVSRYPLLERALRVSVGTPEENDRFLSALDAALEISKEVSP
jgi:histidinol-phosphate aminotransferase